MSAPGPAPTVIVVNPRARPAPPDVQDAVAQAVKVAFGLLSVGLSVALRSAGEAPVALGKQRAPSPVMDAADVLVGTAWGAARVSGRIVATGSRVAQPLVSFAAHPPLVPRRFQPGHAVQVMVTRWQRDRPDTVEALDSWTATILPGSGGRRHEPGGRRAAGHTGAGPHRPRRRLGSVLDRSTSSGRRSR